MNPHGRPWSSDEARAAVTKRFASPAARAAVVNRKWTPDEARAAANRRWSTFRERPQDIYRPTDPERRRNGHRGGLRSGQVRQGKARQRAVQAALDVVREQGTGGLVEAFHRLYAKAYVTGRDAAGQQARARRKTTVRH
jgi:hypothetical protein